MKVYLVGGAVRDKLLGVKASDHDYVVTDTTHDELVKKGFQKVGQTFPIYLDPINRDEHTLADALIQDLQRRDLTINAMALDENGNLIDPFQGQIDIKNKILRHVSRENFLIDPIRVIRTARFAASLPEFSIHEETTSMIKEIIPQISIQDIPSERPLKELLKALTAQRPEIFFLKLQEWGALELFYPELMKSDLEFLKGTCKRTEDVCLRFASLTKGLNKNELEQLSKRLLLSNECYYAANLVVRHLEQFNKALILTADEITDMFYEMDVFRKPESLSNLGTLGDKDAYNYLVKCFEKIKDVSVKDVGVGITGKQIGEEIRKHRRENLQKQKLL